MNFLKTALFVSESPDSTTSGSMEDAEVGVYGGQNVVDFLISGTPSKKEQVYYSFEIRKGRMISGVKDREEDREEQDLFQFFVCLEDGKCANALEMTGVTIGGEKVKVNVTCENVEKDVRVVRGDKVVIDHSDQYFFVVVKFVMGSDGKQKAKMREVFQLFLEKGVVSSKQVVTDQFDGFFGRPVTAVGERVLRARILKNNPYKLLTAKEVSELKEFCKTNKQVQMRMKLWDKNSKSYYLGDHVVKKKRSITKNDFFVLFDGTICDKKTKSNIVHLVDILKKQVKSDVGKKALGQIVYVSGVGTGHSLIVDLFDMPIGISVTSRLEEGYINLCKSIANSGVSLDSVKVHVYGFSRGAFTAISFTNLLKFGIFGDLKAQREAVAKYASGETPKSKLAVDVEFLGLIECVSSIYSNEAYHKMDVSGVKKVLHLLALNENRVDLFPTFPQSETDNILTRWFLGDHENLGSVFCKDWGLLSTISLLEVLKESPIRFSKFMNKGALKKIEKQSQSKSLISVEVMEWFENLIFGLRGYCIRKEFIKDSHMIHPSVFSIINNNKMKKAHYKKLSNLKSVLEKRFGEKQFA